MSVSASVDNPRKLTRESLILVGGGALSGLVATGLNLIAGETVFVLTALAFGGVVGLLANLSDPKAGTPMLRLVLSILGGGAMAALGFVHWALGAAVGGVLLGLAFSLEDGENAMERAVFAGIYGLALIGGLFVTRVLGPMFEIDFASQLFTGATWGVFLAFAGGLKRVQWARDELMSEFKDAYAEMEGPERETIRSGKVLYEQIVKELERTREASTRDRAVEIATETSRALIALTRRSRELRIGALRTSQRQLGSRIVELDERIKNSQDPTVRRELEATLDELVEQVKVRKRFEVARARLEARQQRCFTALERLHVSLVQSASGADDGAVRESIESLERLSDEIRWRNLSVDQLVDGADEEMGEEFDARVIIEEFREEAAPDRETPVTTDEDVQEDEPETQTVLDSGVASDGDDVDEEPPGTDGSDVSHQAQASAPSESR
jgi:hypothetical protein